MTELQVAILLLDVALIVLVARLVGRLARALGQPPVIGEIVAGILLGPTLFHGAVSGTLFPMVVRPHLSTLASVGLVLFMFVVGLEFDFSRLRGSGRGAAGATAIGATVVPLGLGVLLALYLADRHQPANRLGFVLFMAVAVSITAFPVLARILTDRGMSRTLIGTIALSAAAVCDLVAWTLLAVVQAIVGGGTQHQWLILLVIPFALLLFGVVRPGLRRLAARTGPRSAGRIAIVLVGLLISAAVTQMVGLHFVFGAFLFGLAVPRSDDVFREELRHRTEAATMLLLPVYFIVAGLNVDLSRVDVDAVVDFVLIMVTAVAGKFGGTFLAARTQGLSGRQSAELATLMNTRGLTELIALSVGLQIGVLDGGLYSLMVVMAVVTTAMCGPMLQMLSRESRAKELSFIPG
ncbi:cation:proton antiporter [Actinocrispum wychmicini]|uniref:Kef-type K+ transport system membrane component KefB n=1 Tax=Actinocrispum wychmicini TaxID=1213861 RepID=A0A4R2JUR5_9PSEU|nr:cation:proton antiporter [Actinocrispum wychmicini]TCO60779.1 Kef-type K+ transport system membrane component KefB [Actinocrispum wychmicini]